MVTRARILAALGTAIAVTTLVSACNDRPSPNRTESTVTTDSPRAEKTGTGEKRTDLPPLLKRFAALGKPQSATWYSGTLGDDDVPGPSSYWIDAVVALDAYTTKILITTYAAEPTDTRPETVPELRADLPSGELLRSPQLDRAFSTEFSTQVWIERKSGRLVLTAKGQ